MAMLILLLIVSGGLQVGASDLDTAFKAFLTSSLTPKSFQDNSVVVQNLFKLYKNEFNRPAMTSIEEKIRFAAFNDTVFVLLKDYQQGSKTYTVGLNKYADWTSEELSSLRGLRRPQGEISSTNAKPNQRFLPLDGKEIQSKTIALPSSYDYTTRVVTGTNTSIVRPIKEQGQCGSCYAFAFIALLEAQYAFQLKSGTDLSQQQIVDCSTWDLGCNGGYFTRTFYYFTTNTWQVNDAISYPYTAKANKCAFKSVGGGGVTFGSLLYNKLQANNASAMQQALLNYGPLWVSFFAGDQTNTTYKLISKIFNSYTSGIFQPEGCPTSIGTANHAVVIVGYAVDATTNISYWKVRNSWGSKWGESGYFRIRRGVNMCGIESDVFYIGIPA